jgi:hypothetical protein
MPAVVPTKNQVARWAAALTLGQPAPIADAFNTTKFFAQAPLRIHYAAVFNGATATQVHHVSPFNWICCLQPEDLEGSSTGAALVSLVEGHLTDQLKATNAERAAAAPEGVPETAAAAAETTVELPLIGEDV